MAHKKRRRPPPPKARSEAENEILEKVRWSRLRANESLHTQAENNAARQRCRKLIDGGVAAVDWVELYRQKSTIQTFTASISSAVALGLNRA